MDDLNRIKEKIKKRDINYSNPIKKYVFKILITGVITLTVLIAIKGNQEFKTIFYKYVYQDNISFLTINTWYENRFGSSLPFKKLFKEEIKPVFKDALQYENKSLYKDGVKLIVSEDYLIPTLNAGMVIFIGDKEEYGQTVIIEQLDGIEVWYSNLENISIKIYDYIEAGTILGNALDNELYLVFEKDGAYLNYDEFI